MKKIKLVFELDQDVVKALLDEGEKAKKKMTAAQFEALVKKGAINASDHLSEVQLQGFGLLIPKYFAKWKAFDPKSFPEYHLMHDHMWDPRFTEPRIQKVIIEKSSPMIVAGKETKTRGPKK